MNDTVYGVSPGLVLHEMYTVGCAEVVPQGTFSCGYAAIHLGAPCGIHFIR